MFSYDRALKKIILRQFHAEGFGNKCVLEFVGSDGKVHEFATVRIQKYSARLEGEGKMSDHLPDEIIETFSLAAPGKEFEVYSEANLRRKR